ncbi:PREDICTED: ribosomal biogenesis protein LAS1L-like, partial [Priapulus caudatus]|uniref:Ribosomal biogenesis protein LAS1L-like n=1 Tax=Priapulus caudatus TaxID=37621 RepID=A0ABM1EXK7_PRICU
MECIAEATPHVATAEEGAEHDVESEHPDDDDEKYSSSSEEGFAAETPDGSGHMLLPGELGKREEGFAATTAEISGPGGREERPRDIAALFGAEQESCGMPMPGVTTPDIEPVDSLETMMYREAGTYKDEDAAEMVTGEDVTYKSEEMKEEEEEVKEEEEEVKEEEEEVKEDEEDVKQEE